MGKWVIKTNNCKAKVIFNNVFEIIIRYLLCLIFPPLAVFDKGCGTILLVLLLTLLGWIPGTVVALIICLTDKKKIGDSNE